MASWDWLLRGLGGLGGLACIVLLPGCYRGQALGLEHQHVVFAPGSRLLLINQPSNDVRAGASPPAPVVIRVELTGPRELWRTTVPSPTIVLSSSARFAAVLGPHASPGVLRVGLLELDSGKFRDLGVLAPDTAPDHMLGIAAALSDDGALFASVLDGQLRVWETATGRLATEQRFGETPAKMVSFIEGAHDLYVALAQTPDQPLVSLVVLARSPTGWRTEQTLDGVYAFAWTKRGLLFASAAGVSRYDRRASELLVADMKLTAGRFSSDGRYAAYLTAQGALNVYDFEARRVVLSAAWHQRVRFHGNFITAMSNGKLWRGNLATGTSKVLKDFGAPAETVKIPLFGGTSTKTHYEYELNPEGTLLYHREPNADARVYVLDEL